MKIYHNPRCRKSREALQMIQATGKEVEVIEYLKKPLSAPQLHDVIKLLGIAPEALIRKNEAIFKENFKGKSMTDDAWIKAMVEHPKLMERPIVVDGTRAVIGRPPENVKKLL
jgi:arsenate reductase